MSLKVAVAQYDISFFAHIDDFSCKLEEWFNKAKDLGAELLVFPEYASMELTSLFGESVYSDLNKQLYAMQSLYTNYQHIYMELAKRYNVVVLAGSFPLQMASQTFRNRAELFTPEGSLGFQDKLIMTRFENEQWLIHAGHELKVFNTDLGKIGVNICYDSEFPMFARQQVEAGADIILVPSCTDGDAGFHRVRIGSQARALENQCYVLQSPTVGDAPWSPAVDANTGFASIYAPIERALSANGILAECRTPTPTWLFAELDLKQIAYMRQQGQVLNHRDWPKQYLAQIVNNI